MTNTNKPITAQGFLGKMQPDGVHVVTAIHPERNEKRTLTVTFRSDAKPGSGGRHLRHPSELQDFIDENEGWNFYFQANRTINSNMTSKAAVADIASLDYMQVDIDPTAGMSLQDEQERILGLLTCKLPKGIPKPSVIVYSGGGYQAFWKLEEPLKIDGDLGLAEDAKLYNKRLEEIFDADHCHSVAHLMRLPFTINIPDEGKQAKGREKVQAVVMEADFNRTYPIEKFKKSKRPSSAPLGAVERLNISKIVEPAFEDLVKAQVTDATMQTMLHGKHPDDPDKHHSRSEWVFDVACNLARKNVPDEMIVGALLNKDWGSSDSIYRQMSGQPVSNPTRYAVRQVERAKAALRVEREANENVKGDLKFKVDGHGKPYKKLTHNHRVAMQELGVSIVKDLFNDCYIVSGLDGFDGRLTDPAVTRIRYLIEEQFQFLIGKDAMRDLICDIGEYNRFHPVRDYLDSLQWDGVKRLDSWMTKYLGVEDTAYTRAVGRLFLTAAVRRVREPGCKFDEMVVLEGRQGGGKSTALRTLAMSDKWFTDELPLGASGKEIIEATGGKWIVEAAELVGVTKKTSEQMKSMLSRTFDKGRPAYGYFSDQRDRQFVICGTTNDDKYLKDKTGNRRFWPVVCGKIGLNSLKEDRDQIWAEAATVEAERTSIRLDPSLYALAAGEQTKREEENPLEAVFDAKLGGLTGRFPVGVIYDLLGMPKTQQSMTLIGQAAKSLGWDRKKLAYQGARVMCYARGDLAERVIELMPRRDKDGVWRIAPVQSDDGREPWL